jgi:hypothetical protein
VTIPNSVTSIGYAAFRECYSLTSVTIPNSVTSIGSTAFYRCYGLKNVAIGSGVTSIGQEAFYSCNSLVGVSFKGNAPSIGSDSFHDTSATVYYLAGATGYAATWAGRPTALWVLPAITTQPLGLTVTQGATAFLSVTATSIDPIIYQWMKNGVDIAGATSSSLTLGNAQALDVASYTVRLTNFVGSVTSNVAKLMVRMTSSSTLVAWGSNDSGEGRVPSGLSGVKAIAAGEYHTVALKADGTVAAWGMNDTGESNVPIGLSGVTAIAAGYSHSVALKNDKTVAAWGNDWSDQCAVPAGLSGVTVQRQL